MLRKVEQDMKRYKITFEFLNDYGKWIAADLTNNGKGFTYEEANRCLHDLETDSVCIKRYITIEEL